MRGLVGWIVAMAACSAPGGRPPAAPAVPAASAKATATATPTPAPAAEAATADASSAPAAPADPRAPQIELAFAGDVMFGRYDTKGLRPIAADQHDVFGAVASLLDSDFTLVNLETPILRTPPKKSPYGTRMRFVATPLRVKSLLAANIDGVTLANNHAFDMHHAGVVETPEVLDELGIRYIGARRDAPPNVRAETIEVAGWKVAFIAAAAVWNGNEMPAHLPFVDPKVLAKKLVPVVEEARADHDLVIVVLHWGTEYADAPDAWQVKAAHALIDAGADAVIGSHPHVIQGIERYGRGLVAYSLGNFLFDNMWHEHGWHGVLRLTFRRDARCLAAVTYHPTVGTHPYYAPVPATGTHFDDVAGRLRKLSRTRPLRTQWTVSGDHLEVAGACP